MTHKNMTKHWGYKNFNMVVELDIAGECIYNGIHDIYRIKYFANDGSTFCALYNISVGIERLQKIVCVLWRMDAYDDVKEFEKSLITHSHTGLRDKVKETLKSNNVEIIFNERENDFFTLLDNFYNSARYNRFNVDGDWNKELILLRSFAEKYDLIDDGMDFYPDQYLSANPKMKEFIGRTVGSISRKYYDVIIEGSRINNTYTYELRSDSKASKIFRCQNSKNSLMSAQIDESIAYKELLVFYRNTKCKDAFFKFIEDVEPLEFDPVMVCEYLETAIKGEIPQSLIDDVECMYENVKDKKNRLTIMDIFANSSVSYDYPHIEKGLEILNKIKEEKEILKSDIDSLALCAEYVYEDDLIEIIYKAVELARQYKGGSVGDLEFHSSLNEIIDEYKEYIYIPDADPNIETDN